MKLLIDTHSDLSINPFAILPIFVPILKYVPIVNSKFNAFIRNRDGLFEFIEKQISEHEKLSIEKDNDITDFVFAFFNEMKQRQNNKSTDDHSFVYDTSSFLFVIFFYFIVDNNW